MTPMTPTQPPKTTRRQTRRDTAPGASQDSEQTPTRKRRRVTTRMTDSGRVPALRLNRYVGRKRAERKPSIVYDIEHAPAHLRVTRLLLGLSLLLAAWATTLLLVALTDSLIDVFPHQPSLTIRFGLYVMGAIGLIWLALVALGLILVGALSLYLALTRRAW